jgi:hypothetical protein
VKSEIEEEKEKKRKQKHGGMQKNRMITFPLPQIL